MQHVISCTVYNGAVYVFFETSAVVSAIHSLCGTVEGNTMLVLCVLRARDLSPYSF